MVFTPLTIACYTTGTYIEQTLLSNVTTNVLTPSNIGVNALYEFFPIFSDVVAEMANAAYQDSFSFSYWLGDLVYRLVVVSHPDFNIQFL